MKATTLRLFVTYLTAIVVMLSSEMTQAALFSSFLQENRNVSGKLETIDWDDFYTDMSEIGDNESLLEQWSESVQELVEQPLALNSASKQELSDLPFLNEKLVEEISYYLYRYGPMKDLAELRLIEGMDDIRYRLLCHLVYPGDTLPVKKTKLSLKTVLQRGKHDIRLQLGRTLEQKKGYRQSTQERQRYLGDAWSSTIRYGFSYKRNIQFGFTAQKDAGEPWLLSNSRPDYLSGHVLIKDLGWCNALVLGDYTLTLGQGLICGQSFQIGKGSFTGNLGSASTSIKRHASSGEATYFKGIAFDVNLLERLHLDKNALNITLVGFLSNQRMDGSITENTLTSIVKTGLHRTPDEMEQRHTVKLLSGGWSLGVRTRWGRFNLNQLTWAVDKPLQPTWHPYNQFQLHGSKGSGTSLDYRVLVKQFTCFGEVAVDHGGHMAIQGGCYTTPVSGLSLTIHYRNHGIKYNAWHAGAFGENSQINNERGFYASLSWEATKELTLSGYIDTCVFPWLTYTSDEPSGGNKACIQGILQLNSTYSLLIRYTGKNSTHNWMAPEEKNPWMSELGQHQLRVQYTESLEHLEMRTIIDAKRSINSLEGANTEGYALSQSIKYTPRFLPVKLTGKIAYFDIPDYENRITSFEPSLPGSSRFPTFYGNGSRLCLLCCYTMGTTVQWWLDISRWKYTDRSNVGTGLEETAGNHLTTVQLLVRLKI